MNRSLVVLIALAGLGCSDISSVKTGELQIAPEEVVFRELDPGSRVGTALVEVRNVGDARIGISNMRLEELDERSELSIIDIEDHQGERFLDPGTVEFVDLEWRALDAQADEGRFIVTLADGSEVAVPVRTPDIDPRIRVESDPMGMPTEEGLTVQFLDAAPSEFQSAIITVSSQSIAALELSTLCLLTPEGDCLEDNRDSGFMICNGRPLEPSGCMPLMTPDSALGFEDEFTFTAFYQPGVNDVDRVSRQVLIESNARIPTFFISFVGEPCIRMTPSDVCGLCGDGEINGREACDDGNVDNGDGCTNTCTLPVCGDGVVQGGEECDDGNNNDNDPCTNTCTNAICGDGVVFDGLEACDDGNDDNTDECTNDCQSTGCGDGILQEGEACDDGNQNNNDGCTTDCVATSCGDMVLQGTEGCDDGNQETETCAYGETSCQVCDSTCNVVNGATSYCGDERIDSSAAEQCDDGNALTETCPYGLPSCMVCDASCQNVQGAVSFCGDGIVDSANGEACEPGIDAGCNYGADFVFYDNSNAVPAANGNMLYVIDVQGISEAERGDIISRGNLMDFEASFDLFSVSEIVAASQNGNQIASRTYLLVAILADDFYEPGGNNPFQHAFQFNNQTSMSGTDYARVAFDAYWSSNSRNVAVSFVNADMFTNGYYDAATLTTWVNGATGATRQFAYSEQGSDELTLSYNYNINDGCGAPSDGAECIAAGQLGECTFGVPVDPCERPNPPPECNPDPCAQANPPAECNETPDYGGQFVLNPIVQHQCSIEGFVTLVDIALSQLIFTETGNSLIISSFSQTDMPPLRQSPMPSDGTFDATATVTGGCNETFRIYGSFNDSTRREFTATFSASFSGSQCDVTNCTNGRTFTYDFSGLRVGTQ